MSYTKKLWKDRISQYPNRRTLNDGNTTKVVTVGRDEGTITQTGDVFNATNMNDLEDRIESAFDNFDADIQMVENIADVAETTAPIVCVTHNNHSYGDGGMCWFAERADETLGGVARNNGSYVFPLPNQTLLRGGNAPYNKIMNVVKSFVGQNGLTYGNGNTMYDTTCTNEIDCSTFVTAVLNGITYPKSRYVLGTGASNVLGEILGDTRLAIANNVWTRLLSYNMASWFGMHKQLYLLPANSNRAAHLLQFGDILFSGSEAGNFFGIGHVAVVIGTIPEKSAVIVAQAGGSGWQNNYPTTVKTSCILLTNETIASTYKVFARPSYSQDNEGISLYEVLKLYADNNAYVFSEKTGVKFQQNTVFTGATGRMTNYKTIAATPDFYEVEPSATVTYIGAIKDGANIPFVSNVFEYDENKSFIQSQIILASNGEHNPMTLSATTKYIRFTFGHLEGSNTPVLLADFKDFKAKIT